MSSVETTPIGCRAPSTTTRCAVPCSVISCAARCRVSSGPTVSTSLAAVPPAVRSQLSALEDDQKRRATRSLRDGIDRVLTDLESMFRDVLMLQFGRDTDLINRELETDLRALAAAWSPERTLTDAEVERATTEVVEVLARECGAVRR